MKRKLLALFCIVILSFTACGQNPTAPASEDVSNKTDDPIEEKENSDEADNSIKEKDSDEADTPIKEKDSDEEKEVLHDFDPNTNISEENFGICYQVPSSWEKSASDDPNSICYLSNDSMLIIDHQSVSSSDMPGYQDKFLSTFADSIQNFSETGRTESTICGIPSLSLSFTGILSNEEVVGNISTFSIDTQFTSFFFASWGDYDHSSDFSEIVNSITLIDNDKDSEPTESPTTPDSTDENSSATVGQKNALKSAHNYLEFSPFSYSGLIHQLEYEKFSTEEATYAADNCGADWNEQAVKAAKNYLDYSGFSYNGLIGQLEYEGFSTEEATYAVDNCDADWNEQAAIVAKNYMDYSSFSRDGLISQLEYEGFTREQAEYGVAAVGY